LSYEASGGSAEPCGQRQTDKGFFADQSNFYTLSIREHAQNGDHPRIAETGRFQSVSRLHHLALLLNRVHGLPVSELLALTVNDVQGDHIVVHAKKRGKSSLETLHRSSNPLFDETQLAVHAQGLRQIGEQRLFPFCRHYADRLIRKYGEQAGIPARSVIIILCGTQLQC
jgi:integrase